MLRRSGYWGGGVWMRWVGFTLLVFTFMCGRWGLVGEGRRGDGARADEW